MKAYRLSTFLYYTARGLRPKPFPHARVVKYTGYFVLFTVLILLVCSFVDPPIRTRVIVDPYRPRLDYYVCQVNTPSQYTLSRHPLKTPSQHTS